MDELQCPRCKTTKYRNPALKLMVNVCGHALCENCVELLFVRGSGACPECGVALRRSNFRLQLFEDPAVEKEVDIRKRVLRDYNKKEEDFASLREYNDYLEEVETIVYNLAHGQNVEEMRKRIELYKKQNQDQIRKNRSKLSKEDEMLEEMIEIEQKETEFYREQARVEELNAQKEKRKNNQNLIEELMFSDLPADHIIAAHKRETLAQLQEAESKPKAKPTLFSSGVALGKKDNIFAPIPSGDVGEIFLYTPIQVEIFGPECPAWEDLSDKGYLANIRTATGAELGGGYETEIGCMRALQEAYCGLFFSMKGKVPAAASVK